MMAEFSGQNTRQCLSSMKKIQKVSMSAMSVSGYGPDELEMKLTESVKVSDELCRGANPGPYETSDCGEDVSEAEADPYKKPVLEMADRYLKNYAAQMRKARIKKFKERRRQGFIKKKSQAKEPILTRREIGEDISEAEANAN